MNYTRIEKYRICIQDNAPHPLIKPLAQPGDYELVATVKAVTPLSDGMNRVIVDVIVDDIAFAFTANEIGDTVPSAGDIISCTVRGLSLWDEAL